MSERRSAQRRHERKLEKLALNSHSVGTRCGCGIVEGVTANGLQFEALDKAMRKWDAERTPTNRGIVRGLAMGIAVIQARSVDPTPRAKQIERESLARVRS